MTNAQLCLFAGIASAVAGIAVVAAAAAEICVSENKTFTAHMNLYGSELGDWVFEECGMHNHNPVIAMEVGETYTFIQEDRTNYYHPLGFAYTLGGETEDEVEPGNSKGLQDCIADLSCPAPMYFSNDTYLGRYSNNPNVMDVTAGEADFGLDVYEPLFLRSPAEWTSMGPFSIKLLFDEAIEHPSDLFYFCHIHDFMGGRIKLTKNGEVLNAEDTPELVGHDSEPPSDFDQKCGTYDLGSFTLPNPLCPERFVCFQGDEAEAIRDFSHCIDAMNCHQLSGMTTGVKAQSAAALFIHQMIPHHQNAVNMAKALLKTSTLKCDDLSVGEEDMDCMLEGMMYEIVNNQNLQIQQMRHYLEAKSYPETDNCDVYLKTISEEDAIGTDATDSQSNTTEPPSASTSGSSHVAAASISLLGMGVAWSFLGAL